MDRNQHFRDAAPAGEQAPPLGPYWTSRFALIERAGGPQWRKIAQLRAEERFRVGFNVAAFFFGPFYYLYKGMWRRGLTLFAIAVAVAAALDELFAVAGHPELGNAIGYGMGAIYASKANIDYYKQIVLGDDGWW